MPGGSWCSCEAIGGLEPYEPSPPDRAGEAAFASLCRARPDWHAQELFGARDLIYCT